MHIKLQDLIDQQQRSTSRGTTPQPPVGEELTTLSCSEPGTALRIALEPCPDGHVRLEQLAYSESLGWYVQKTFCIPAELLAAVATELRKANCLLPRQQTPPLSMPTMKIAGPTPPAPPSTPRRREA